MDSYPPNICLVCGSSFKLLHIWPHIFRGADIPQTYVVYPAFPSSCYIFGLNKLYISSLWRKCVLILYNESFQETRHKVPYIELFFVISMWVISVFHCICIFDVFKELYPFLLIQFILKYCWNSTSYLKIGRPVANVTYSLKYMQHISC